MKNSMKEPQYKPFRKAIIKKIVSSATANPDEGKIKPGIIPEYLLDLFSVMMPIKEILNAFYNNDMTPIFESLKKYGIEQQPINNLFVLFARASDRNIGDFYSDTKTSGNSSFQLYVEQLLGFLKIKLETELKTGLNKTDEALNESERFYNRIADIVNGLRLQGVSAKNIVVDMDAIRSLTDETNKFITEYSKGVILMTNEPSERYGKTSIEGLNGVNPAPMNNGTEYQGSVRYVDKTGRIVSGRERDIPVDLDESTKVRRIGH
ncbi:MAG TPA: hypothetical protein PLC53_00685 [Bacilli bacterium]|nr:hypothetical protein [Bacilli bacterium]